MVEDARTEAATEAIINGWKYHAHPVMRDMYDGVGYREQATAIAVRALAAADAHDLIAGEALLRARLALTALALLDDGFSDDKDEPGRILVALCNYLVGHGVVAPTEG